LKGKGAVVTGAASGIGKAIATAFIDAGASVLLCDLNAKALDDAAASWVIAQSGASGCVG
jgi:NAD(P)-dependent dehydrogenase (short-subunit alcohol dehydrogenase family)